MSPTFTALRIRNFRLFVFGQIVSNTGTWMQRVAQDWLVLQLSGGSGTALGITTALQFLPLLLFSLWGGVLADRLPKRTVLVVTQAVMGLQALTLGLLVVTNHAQLWQVYVLAFLLGCVTALDNPTRQSFVPEMVGTRDLPNAVALGSATFNLGRVLGPAAAGLLIAAVGTGPVFLINAASYLAVIASLLVMRPQDLRPTRRAPRGPGALRAGLSYVRHHAELRLIILLVAVVGTFGLNFQITIALMATQEFGKGAKQYGLLGTAFAIGSLTGALLSARRAGRTGSKPSMRRVLLLAVGFAAMEVIAGLAPTYGIFFVLLIPTGIFALSFITSANATLQLSAEPAMRGRVMALYTLVFFGGTPIGAPFIGWLAQSAGARWSLIGGGAITLAASVAAYLWYRAATGSAPLEQAAPAEPIPVDGSRTG